jgi:electron transfer flavoprotein-quinone oxidoreductase
MLDFSFSSPELLQAPSYTVLRREFDAWCADRAVQAGAQLITPIKVDELYYRQGCPAGIVAGGESLAAQVIILCEGVNGILAAQAGLTQTPAPSEVALGFKEIIKLPAELIEQRFNLAPGQGAARLLAGLPLGLPASGGFLYTNQNSLSLGLVVSLESALASPEPLPDLLENFKNHPAISPLLAGGETVEYSARLVPESGYYSRKLALGGDNILLAGDGAGMVINHGYTVQGMDLALLAGQAAAQAVLACREGKSYQASSLLPAYKKELAANGVLGRLRAARHMPALVRNPRLSKEYPALAADLCRDLFSFDERPPQPLFKARLLPRLRRIGLFTLLKDAWQAIKALG